MSTLLGIESRILQLMEQRQEMVTEGVDVTEIEALIVAEMQQEVQKVDGCAAYDRHLERQVRAYHEEIDRLEHEQSKIIKQRERYQDLLFGVMKRLGINKITGKLGGYLAIKQNPPAVQIDQPGMLPNEYKRVKVTMSMVEYLALVADTELSPALSAALNDVSTPEPMKSEIARALKNGEGVPGASLESAERLVIK